MTSRAEVGRQLARLGVRRGGVLLVHTSFRAVRPVEEGPQGLIGALLDAVGEEGTLVMPSWSGDDDTPFDRFRSPAAADLGIVPQMFWKMPGVERSDHAFAFAAFGARAGFVVGGPLPLPPHIPASPVGRVHELDGQVLLLGVSHDANTTIHLAELMAGVPYRLPKSCTVLRDGVLERVEYGENDHCCRRFLLVDDWVDARGTQSTGTVGHATARLVSAGAIVDEVVPRLTKDPLLFLHDPPFGCPDCDAARRSVRP